MTAIEDRCDAACDEFLFVMRRYDGRYETSGRILWVVAHNHLSIACEFESDRELFAVKVGNCGREQAASTQHVAHGGEAEFSEQLSQTSFAAVKVCVVAEAGQPAHIDPRLPRVDLPRVQVESEWPVARIVDLAQSLPSERVRQ